MAVLKAHKTHKTCPSTSGLKEIVTQTRKVFCAPGRRMDRKFYGLLMWARVLADLLSKEAESICSTGMTRLVITCGVLTFPMVKNSGITLMKLPESLCFQAQEVYRL